MSGHRNWREIRTQREIPRGDFRAQQKAFPGFDEFEHDIKKDAKAVTLAAIFLVIVMAAVLVAVVGVVLYLLLKNFG